MPRPFKIDPDSWYDDISIRTETGITESSLAKARRGGELKFTTRGGRIRYLGAWLLSWLAGEPAEQREPAQVGAA